MVSVRLVERVGVWGGYVNMNAEFDYVTNFEFGFRPFRARYFLLLTQEKVPKEKGTRRTHRLAPVSCVPRQSGAAHNSELYGVGLPAPYNLPQTERAANPGLAAVLGECNGTGVVVPYPLAQPSIAEILR